MPIERLQPPGLQGSPLFTQVIKAGNTVYIAGQIAVDQDGHVVGRGDITAQATQVFENLQRALAAAGAAWSHLVKITVYATDAGFRDPIRDVRRRYLGSPDPVASTFVVVAGLALPELLVEIDAIAVLDQPLPCRPPLRDEGHAAGRRSRCRAVVPTVTGGSRAHDRHARPRPWDGRAAGGDA